MANRSQLVICRPGKGREVIELSHADDFPSRPEGCCFPNLWEARGCDRCPRKRLGLCRPLDFDYERV